MINVEDMLTDVYISRVEKFPKSFFDETLVFLDNELFWQTL